MIPGNDKSTVMQHLILFVLCDQDPGCPVPLEFADRQDHWYEYSVHRFQAVPPQTGEQVVLLDSAWTILTMHSYTTDQADQFPTEGFHIAVCTKDGTLPERQDWSYQDKPHFHAVFTGPRGESTNGLEFDLQASMPTKIEHLPKLGEILMDTPEWYVHAIQSFWPVGERSRQGYDQVFVCWCERNPNPPPATSDWEVCPVIPPDPYLMPARPHRSQVLFYVTLTDVQNLSIAETFKLLVELGYTPQLRYREWLKADGERALRLYALLRYEQHDFNRPVDRDYLSDELEVLWGKIVPSTAVSLSKGCPPPQMVSLPGADSESL